jgi:hypothetical protein
MQEAIGAIFATVLGSRDATLASIPRPLRDTLWALPDGCTQDRS